MVRIIQAPPDPRWQSFLDYVSRLQEERYRREQERAQQREAQRGRAAILGGPVVGAIAGASGEQMLQGAMVTAGAAFGGIGGAAAGLSGLQMIPAVLEGAATGAQVGQAFVGGDVAAGLATAAGAARGVMQTMEDQKLYGYSPTPQERAAYAKLALKSGTTMGQLRGMALGSDSTIPEILQAFQVSQAETDRIGDMLADAGIPMSGPEFQERAPGHEGGAMGLFLDLSSVMAQGKAQAAGKKAFAQKYNTAKAEIQIAGELERMEGHIPQHAISEKDQRIEDIHEAWQMGELSDAQAIQQFDRYVGPPLRRVQTQRQTEPDWREDTPKQLGVTQFLMPDGTPSPPVVVRRHPGTPRSPRGEMSLEGWVPQGDDATELLLKHYENMSKATFGATTMREAAADIVLAKQIIKEMEAGTYQQERVVSPAVPSGAEARPAQPTPGPSQAAAPDAKTALQQRVRIAADLLTRVARDFPDPAKWSPEMKEQFMPPAVLLNKLFLERMRQGEILTPEEVTLARFVAQIVQGG